MATAFMAKAFHFYTAQSRTPLGRNENLKQTWVNVRKTLYQLIKQNRI